MPKGEAKLERKLVARGKSMGMIVVKLEAPPIGIPDRLFIMDSGRTVFIEFKNPNGKGRISPEQFVRANQLHKLGHVCYCIDNYEEGLEILEYWNKLSYRVTTIDGFENSPHKDKLLTKENFN